MEHDDSAAAVTLRDSATLHAVRQEMARRAELLVERLRRDPLGDEQTLAQLNELATFMSGERAAAGRAARSRLSAVLAGGGGLS